MQPVSNSNGSNHTTHFAGNFILLSLGKVNCQAMASVILEPVCLKSTVLNIEFFFNGKFHSSAAGIENGGCST
jgi:hypothetical protein